LAQVVIEMLVGSGQCEITPVDREIPKWSLDREERRANTARNTRQKMFQGEVVSIHIATMAGAPMELRQHVEAIVGRGLEGDCYFVGGVDHWSKTPGTGREGSLIEIEALEALQREKEITIAAGSTRRNIETRGVH
jgi:hypothetical protein